MHTFYYFGVGFCCFGFFYCNNTVSSYLCPLLQKSDLPITSSCCRNGCYTCNIISSKLPFWNSPSMMSSTAVFTAVLNAFFQNAIGLAPAVTFFIPSRINACAKQSSCCGTVARNIVCFDGNFFYQAEHPCFQTGSSNSTSFAMVTPSLVIKRCAEFFVQNNIAAFWTKCNFYCIWPTWLIPFM